jgi:dihydrofolate synthase/folylpolyglutamate synthase
VELTGLQGRWQIIQSAPFIILDTAHNVAGVKEIIEQLQTVVYHQLHIVFGMVNDKDVSKVLALLPTNALYYFTQASIQRALPSNELALQSKKYGLIGKAYKNIDDAIKDAKNAAKDDDCIFIGGSNFVVGEALQLLQ